MPISINLTDGAAELMGDGIVLILQDSHEGPKDVAVHLDDLKALVAAMEA